MISVLTPTRGRPQSVLRLLDSIAATASGPVETIFYLDDDDPALQQTVNIITDRGGHPVIGSRTTLSQCWNHCYDHAHGDIAMQCGDDIVFRTPDWDTTVRDAFQAVPDKIVLVHGDDGLQHGGMATHAFLHRRWVDVVGHFVPGIFSSDYSDLWLTHVADALGRRVYLPNLLTEHLHPVAGKAEWDLTYRERLARHTADGVDQTWLATAHLRQVDVEKLRAALEHS